MIDSPPMPAIEADRVCGPNHALIDAYVRLFHEHRKACQRGYSPNMRILNHMAGMLWECMTLIERNMTIQQTVGASNGVTNR